MKFLHPNENSAADHKESKSCVAQVIEEFEDAKTITRLQILIVLLQADGIAPA